MSLIYRASKIISGIVNVELTSLAWLKHCFVNVEP